MKTSLQSGLLFSALNIDCLPSRPIIASPESRTALAQDSNIVSAPSEEASPPPQAGLKLVPVVKDNTSEHFDSSGDESFNSLPWRREMTGDSLDSDIFPAGSVSKSSSMLHDTNAHTSATFLTGPDDKQVPSGTCKGAATSWTEQKKICPPATDQGHGQVMLQLSEELEKSDKSQRHRRQMIKASVEASSGSFQRNPWQNYKSSAAASSGGHQWSPWQDYHGMLPYMSPYAQNSVGNASNVQFCGPMPIPMPVMVQVNLCRNCGAVVKPEFKFCHNCGARMTALPDIVYQ